MDALIAGCDECVTPNNPGIASTDLIHGGSTTRAGRGRCIRGLTFLVCGLGVLTSACNDPPAVNPWVDDSIPEQKWYTPSSESVLVAQAKPSIRHRAGPTLNGPDVDPSVPHYPLWWEDPYEDQGDKDGMFCWTWQDYFALPASYGRFWVDTLGFPASVIVEPPGTHMISDGIPERRGLCDHDAKRGYSNDPNATDRDFMYDGGEEIVPAASSAPAE